MCDTIQLSPAYSFIQLGRRDSQQDARYPDTDTPGAECRTFIVCDGVGGEACGEVASATVANALGTLLDDYAENAGYLGEGPLKHHLSQAAEELDNAVEEGSPSMSTTLTLVHFNTDDVVVAHMGDSRIYQVRPGVGIIFRSNDHSLVNSMVHSGNLTPQEAINHPKSNYITRCMSPSQPGAYPTAADMLRITDIEPGDCFFLCSDGVLHCIDDDELTLMLSRPQVPDNVTCRLIAQLCENSSDNNTAIMVRVKAVPDNLAAFDPDNDTTAENDPSLPCDTTIIAPESQADTIIEITPEPEPQEKSGLLSWLKNLF